MAEFSWKKGRMSSFPRQLFSDRRKEIYAKHRRTRIITSHEKETSPDQKELYNVAKFPPDNQNIEEEKRMA